VLPSRYDGWGVVVNQALGAGLPIICSDMVGAGFDLVEEEVNGARFPVGDSGVLATQMQRFITEPSLSERWGKASRERARLWTPEAGAAKWVDAFKTVLQQRAVGMNVAFFTPPEAQRVGGPRRRDREPPHRTRAAGHFRYRRAA
jgi:glycosyltransferase involved in cell wall biosynthesis